MDTDLPLDWEAQVDRAYAVLGYDPLLDGADEFALFGGRLDPKFLAEKAKQQLRDMRGRFREMRGKLPLEEKQRVARIVPEGPKRPRVKYVEKTFDEPYAPGRPRASALESPAAKVLNKEVLPDGKILATWAMVGIVNSAVFDPKTGQGIAHLANFGPNGGGGDNAPFDIHVAVDEEHRGKGYGMMLLDQAAEHSDKAYSWLEPGEHGFDIRTGKDYSYSEDGAGLINAWLNKRAAEGKPLPPTMEKKRRESEEEPQTVARMQGEPPGLYGRSAEGMDKFRDLLWPERTPRYLGPMGDPAAARRGDGFDRLGYRPGGLVGEDVKYEDMERVVEGIHDAYEEHIANVLTNGGKILSEEEFVDRIAGAIRARLLEHDAVRVRRKIARLGNLHEGSRTQRETGTSSGALVADGRKGFEQKTFGAPYNLADEAAPVYGYLEGSSTDPDQITASQYGDAIVTPKPSVASRTTVTPGDSLDSRSPSAVLLEDLREGKVGSGDLIAAAGPEFLNSDIQGIIETGKMGNNASADFYGLVMPQGYMEAQIHGGLPASDIERITLDRSGARENEREDGSIFGNIRSAIPEKATELPSAEDAFDSIMESMALPPGAFGEPGSPLREQFEEFRRQALDMYRDGYIDSIAQAPGFTALLRNYFASKGNDIEFDTSGVNPPRTKPLSGIGHKMRDAGVQKVLDERLMQEISRFDYANSMYQGAEEEPEFQHVAALLKTPKGQELREEMDRREAERLKKLGIGILGPGLGV